MDTGSASPQCSPAHNIIISLNNTTTDLIRTDTSALSQHLQSLASPRRPYPLHNLNLPIMSGTSGSSSRNWDDVLKHGSALGILKPDVAFPPYGGSSTSGGSSGSNSGGSSGGTGYPSGGSSGGAKR